MELEKVLFVRLALGGIFIGTVMVFLATIIAYLDYALFFDEQETRPMILMLLVAIHWLALVLVFGPINAYSKNSLGANTTFIVMPVILGLLLAYAGAPIAFWYGITTSSSFSGYNMLARLKQKPNS